MNYNYNTPNTQNYPQYPQQYPSQNNPIQTQNIQNNNNQRYQKNKCDKSNKQTNPNYIENKQQYKEKLEKMKGQETQELLENLFDKDYSQIQICIAKQNELASELRKGQSNIKIELKKKYKDQLQFIKNNGFKNSRKVLILLNIENGNEEIVLRKLMLKTLEEQSLKIKFQKQIADLQSQFEYKKCNKELLQILKQTDGNPDQTLKLIDQESKNKKNLELLYKSQLQILALEGWLNSSTKKCIIKTLHKYKGDLNQTKLEIQLSCYHKIKQLTSSEQQKLSDFKCSEHFTEQIENIIVDGNNLLFMNSEIRKNIINKQRNIAERKICHLTKQVTEILDIKNIIIIFDQMYDEIKDNKIQIINCKKTEFKSSDDYIVDYTMKIQKDQVKNTLVITSDQELTYRIINQNQNIQIMKGKDYFKQIEELLSSEIFCQIVQDNDI